MSFKERLALYYTKTVQYAKRKMSGDPTDSQLPEGLEWLVDIPLFIDSKRVEQFHDIVTRSLGGDLYRKDKVESTDESGTEKGVGAKTGGKTGINVATSTLLEALSPLTGEGTVELSGEINAEYLKSVLDSTKYTYTPTPERQLAQVAIHYTAYRRDRLFINKDPNEEDWRTSDSTGTLPRELLFLNLPSQQEVEEQDTTNGEPRLVETKLVPMAAEFEDGAVERLYEKLDTSTQKPPKYPDRKSVAENKNKKESEVTFEEIRIARQEKYWRWFNENFDPTKAMTTVENSVSEHGRIRWIAFRLPLTDQGHTLHLHIEPDEEYATDTFAYNFIKRGYKHGLRLVGTLKNEPDMNVLAVYEK